MKRKVLAILPLLSILSSCVIVNPIYPQDVLNLDLYHDPITLDWSNDEDDEPQNAAFADAEDLRAYLNVSRAVIKEVNELSNVYRGRGALRIGANGSDKDGILAFTLKNVFMADALAIHVYPYYIESFDMFSGQTIKEVDQLGIAINERPYVEIKQNDDDETVVLTFRFETPIDEISIYSETGRGFIFGIDIYQTL